MNNGSFYKDYGYPNYSAKRKAKGSKYIERTAVNDLFHLMLAVVSVFVIFGVMNFMMPEHIYFAIFTALVVSSAIFGKTKKR